jgi:hypothetical protein
MESTNGKIPCIDFQAGFMFVGYYKQNQKMRRCTARKRGRQECGFFWRRMS